MRIFSKRAASLERFCFLIVLLFPFVVFAQDREICSTTAKMQVYSNATFVEEAGDVVGYELAVSRDKKTDVQALLFIYEGVPNLSGIELTGNLTDKKLSLKGTWVEKLIQYPSGRETVQLHPVRLEAQFSSDGKLRGRVTIEGTDVVVLKPTRQLWLCTAKTAK